MMMITNCPHDKAFGNVEVKLEQREEGLFVELITERLRILSVNNEDYLPQFIELYGSREVCQLVGDGSTLRAKAVSDKILRWINRWAEFSPFSGYAVLEKESGEFVGQIILKRVKDENAAELGVFSNVAEIGYLSMPHHWKKGYGKEYTHAMLHHLVPRLVQEGHSISAVIATTRPDNPGSNGILRTFMQFQKELIRYNSPRNFYSLGFNHL